MSEKFANPWRTTKSTIAYENPWISVRHDDVIRPDGGSGIYGVVHFKNRAIGVLPIDKDGYIYLIGQHRYPLGSYSWEIPEGGGPEDEEPLEAAKRELREETGLVARNWELLGRAHLSNSATDEEALFYLATDLFQREAQPEATEKLELMHIPFSEAVRMVIDGEITDAISVMAILRYELAGKSKIHR